MLRPLALLLAVLFAGPVGCDETIPDDDAGDDETSAADDTGDADETGDDTATGEAVDPTPIPFDPPIGQDHCRAVSQGARIDDCDP